MKSLGQRLFKGRAFWTLLWLICLSFTENAISADPDEINLDKNAFIFWNQASTPVGSFLLVRRGKDACAIRFTEHHRGHDAVTPSVFTSGEESLYAEYDWFYQNDGSGDFNKSNVTNGHAKLVEKALRGIGRLAFQTGETQIRCGPFVHRWDYPTSISFSDPTLTRRVGNNGIEMAPTAWKAITEIDISDSRLSWYSYAENRKRTYVPITELPLGKQLPP